MYKCFVQTTKVIRLKIKITSLSIRYMYNKSFIYIKKWLYMFSIRILFRYTWQWGFWVLYKIIFYSLTLWRRLDRPVDGRHMDTSRRCLVNVFGPVWLIYHEGLSTKTCFTAVNWFLFSHNFSDVYIFWTLFCPLYIYIGIFQVG